MGGIRPRLCRLELLPGDGSRCALEKRFGPFEILFCLCGLGLLTCDLRPRLRNLSIGLLHLRLRLRHLRQPLLTLDLKIPLIQPGNHLAGLNRLVFLNQHLRYGAGHRRTDLVNVRGHVGVVRPDPGARIVPPSVG